MRSWTPRRPSPALEQRLFGREASRSAGRHPSERRLPGWGWLAPVACVFALALQLVTPDAGPQPNSALITTASLVSGGWGSQTLLSYARAATKALTNVNDETFKSTNWTTAPSSMRNLPVFLIITNGLIQ